MSDELAAQCPHQAAPSSSRLRLSVRHSAARLAQGHPRPHFYTVDLLALASVNRATRQLLLIPSLWRECIFLGDVLQSQPRPHSSDARPVPSLSAVVQLLLTSIGRGTPLEVESLVRFPNLRHVLLSRHGKAHSGLYSSVRSLDSLCHLTRVTLLHFAELRANELRLLSTLPALAAFAASHTSFRGQHGRGARVAGDEWRRPVASELAVVLPARARRQAFVRHTQAGGMRPRAVRMDHMPVWPHLLCLSVADNPGLRNYPFRSAATQFPSLTSLTSSSRSDAAIAQLVRLPRLEELRFPAQSSKAVGGEERRPTTEAGARAFHRATRLRCVQYASACWEQVDLPSAPNVAALTAFFTLEHLTRLSVPAHWMDEARCEELFVQHRFPHLRCLELAPIVELEGGASPQTDAALLPLVQPADVVVAGRQQRQAARAAKRPSGVNDECRAEDHGATQDISADSAANFPALECLALPYLYYQGFGDARSRVSEWMKKELRRSYEFEVAKEWEAEVSTLGQAKLFKSMP